MPQIYEKKIIITIKLTFFFIFIMIFLFSDMEV